MKINREQLSNLIKEEFQRQNKLSILKKHKKHIEKQLKRLDEGFEFDSGSNYAPGTEHDPNAPWNERDPHMMECPVCHGTGKDPDDESEPCYSCGGTGEVEDEDYGFHDDGDYDEDIDEF